MESGISLGDLFAVMNNRERDSWGNGSGAWIWIIFLFFIFIAFMGGGFGGLWGNRNATGGDAPLSANSYAIGNLSDGTRGLQQGICDSTYTLAGEITGLGAQMQNCCCGTQKEIIESRYAAERNTCDIVNAIHADGEATRALINQNVMQELRDNLQAAQLQLGQLSQTQALINELKPFPVPAYITCSPYATNTFGCGYTGGYGFNGCGCNV